MAHPRNLHQGYRRTITNLQDAEGAVSAGAKVAEASRRTGGVAEQTLWRWRIELGGLRVN